MKADDRWWKRLLRSRGLGIFVLVIGGAWLMIAGLDAAGGPHAIRERYGMYAALVLVAVQTAAALTPVPSELVAVPTAAIYDFWLGFVLIWFGWVAATRKKHGIPALSYDPDELATDLQAATGAAGG